jgi:hypothetical protein
LEVEVRVSSGRLTVQLVWRVNSSSIQIWQKYEKLNFNSFINQLGKNTNLAKLTFTFPRAYIRARIVVDIVVSL